MKNNPFKKKCLGNVIDSYFNEYLTEHNDIVPDTESLAAFIGITRAELNALEESKKYGRLVKSAKTRIAAAKKQLAYRGKLPPTVLAFDLRNDHGYRDKPDEVPQTTVILKGVAEEWGD